MLYNLSWLSFGLTWLSIFSLLQAFYLQVFHKRNVQTLLREQNRNSTGLEPLPPSDLTRLIEERKKGLVRVSDYVKKGELARFPLLESAVTRFVTETQTFDQNVLRLEVGHWRISIKLHTLLKRFLTDFHSFLGDTQKLLTKSSNQPLRFNGQGKSPISSNQHEILNHHLHELKVDFSSSTSSLIDTIDLNLKIVIAKLASYASPDRTQGVLANPAFPATKHHFTHMRQTTASPKVVECVLDLPPSHTGFIALQAELSSIVLTQFALDAHVIKIEEELWEMYELLRDFSDQLKELDVNNLGIVTGWLLGTVSRLNKVLAL